MDVADPLTKPVLTGTDYKKDDLLEAARRYVENAHSNKQTPTLA